MARGADGKAKRKEKRKEEREETNRLMEEIDNEGESGEDDENKVPYFGGHDEPIEANDDDADLPMPKMTLRKTKIKKKKAPTGPPPSPKKKIKSGPLVMLCLLFGTTMIPVLLYFGDWAGGMIQKHHIMGNLGYKLGVGPSPRQRVLSFYEKHDPTKIEDVPKILAKHYGEYPKLIKKLERKYGDYGYFLNWEDDEAPYKLAKEKLELTAEYLGKQWQRHAPQPIKNAVRNMKYNLTFLYKKGKVIWKKKIWPTLEPFFGVPEGGAAQKRKDAQANSKKKRGKRNAEYRDDDEF